MSGISETWPSLLKLFPLKLNACSRTRAEATVCTVPFIRRCVPSVHTGTVHYTFMSTFVAVCRTSTPVTIPAVGQEVCTRTMERQASKSPLGPLTQTGFVNVPALAHVSAYEWSQCCACTYRVFWSTATLPTSARVPGDYVPDWHMLEFTSIGLLCADWRLDFSSPDNFIKTVMVRQSDWQAENKRMKGRRRGGEDTGKTAWHEWSWL